MRATQKDVHAVLKATSRTFFIPIVRLPGGIQEAVASAYLCMRAIDEIEDHPALENLEKARLLRGISLIFQAQTSVDDFAHRLFFRSQRRVLRVFQFHREVFVRLDVPVALDLDD